MLKQMLKQEQPTIVKFKDGNYGIRKKDIWTIHYAYLDLQDISPNSSVVNWRTHMTRGDVYNWCTHGSIVHVHELYTTLRRQLDKKVNCIELTQEQIDNLLEEAKDKG